MSQPYQNPIKIVKHNLTQSRELIYSFSAGALACRILKFGTSDCTRGPSLQNRMSDWISLPSDLKCKILALLPVSRSKLALRFVAKEWAAILDSPAAHGEEIGRLDLEDIPSRHLLPVKALDFGSSLRSLEELPMNNILLELSGSLAFEEDAFNAYPEFRSLRKLSLLLRDSNNFPPTLAPPLDPSRFPSLECLVICTLPGQDESEALQSLFGRLQEFQILRRVEYETRRLFDVDVPQGCSVKAACDWGGDLLDLQPQTKSCLTHLGFLCVEGHDMNQQGCLDFAWLHDFPNLREVTLQLADDVYYSPWWGLSGLEVLPSSLEHIFISSCRVLPSFRAEGVASVEVRVVSNDDGYQDFEVTIKLRNS